MSGNTARAGLLYFVSVFAVGFVLGAVRVLLVEPRIGIEWSVAAELPVMLAVSWFAARTVVTRFRVEATFGARLAMGLLACVLLVVAETVLGLAFGQSLARQLAAYVSLRGLLTLAGQLGFALMPLFV